MWILQRHAQKRCTKIIINWYMYGTQINFKNSIKAKFWIRNMRFPIKPWIVTVKFLFEKQALLEVIMVYKQVWSFHPSVCLHAHGDMMKTGRFFNGNLVLWGRESEFWEENKILSRIFSISIFCWLLFLSFSSFFKTNLLLFWWFKLFF